MQIEKQHTDYSQLVSQISEVFERGQRQAVLAVNSQGLSNLYRMRQFYQVFPILAEASQELKGFSVSNVKSKRQLYIVFPISAELPH
jgi:hypothetical protein